MQNLHPGWGSQHIRFSANVFEQKASAAIRETYGTGIVWQRLAAHDVQLLQYRERKPNPEHGAHTIAADVAMIFGASIVPTA
jgi:hypothetical protein